MTRSRKPHGFTLIEVMMVSAIIGALATVALPEYQRFVVRAKIPERKVLMTRIKQGVQDAYLRNQLTAAGLTGPATPGVVPGKLKMMPNWAQADWNVIFASAADIEGAIYYQYAFSVAEAPRPTLTITATGDLDADGTPTVKACTYERKDGAYQIDPGTLPGTGCVCTGSAVPALDCEPENSGVF